MNIQSMRVFSRPSVPVSFGNGGAPKPSELSVKVVDAFKAMDPTMSPDPLMQLLSLADKPGQEPGMAAIMPDGSLVLVTYKDPFDNDDGGFTGAIATGGSRPSPWQFYYGAPGRMKSYEVTSSLSMGGCTNFSFKETLSASFDNGYGTGEPRLTVNGVGASKVNRF